MTFNLAADAPLLKAFAILPDPRKSRNQIYPLIDIIAVAVIGILCSGNDWISIVNWANAYQEWFKSVGLCLNGIPSHDTIGRFFRLVDPQSFETCFTEWVKTITDKIQGVVAIDGKTIRNSGDSFKKTRASHIVTAFAAENDIILGQLKTPENRIEASTFEKAEKKAKAIGKIEGKIEGKTEMARNLLASGVAISVIATASGLSEEELLSLDVK